MKTITLRQYHDRDGRLWTERPDRPDELEHDAPGPTSATIYVPRDVLEYLAGPLTEAP